MTTTSLPLTRLEQTITDRVRRGAPEWFPGLRLGEVRLRLLASRPRSLTYAVHLDPAASAPQVLAKVRRGSLVEEGTGSDRPRLAPDLLGARELTAFEYQGLEDLYTVFSASTEGLRAVRPLEHLVDEDAILMEYVDGRTLRRLVAAHRRVSRRSTASDGLPPSVWERTGRWLRVFHDQVSCEGLATRQAGREAVVDRFVAYQDYLGDHLRHRAFPDLGTAGAALAADVLPSRLPVAVGHGDFAPRNVLLAPAGSLAVFDPLPRWAVPRHEDLARFLVGLRLPGPQLVSHGTALDAGELDHHARSVVRGYFGDETVPSREVRCYELLVLLDTWAELVSRSRRTGRGRAHAAVARLAGTYLKSQAHTLLRLAEQGR